MIMPCIKGKTAKLHQSLDTLETGVFTVKHHLKKILSRSRDLVTTLPPFSSSTLNEYHHANTYISQYTSLINEFSMRLLHTEFSINRLEDEEEGDEDTPVPINPTSVTITSVSKSLINSDSIESTPIRNVSAVSSISGSVELYTTTPDDLVHEKSLLTETLPHGTENNVECSGVSSSLSRISHVEESKSTVDSLIDEDIMVSSNLQKLDDTLRIEASLESENSIQCKADSESGQLASENQYNLSKCILAPVFKPSNQHAANAPVTTERDTAVDQISESLKTEKTEEILDNGVNIKCEQNNTVENVSEILESPSVNVAECKVDNISLKVNPKNEEILENSQSENKMISLETSRSVKPSNHLPIDNCIELSSEDHQWPVVINHIVSPGEFYVQSTVTTDLSRMKNLLGLLNETYYNKSSQLCRYHKIKNNFRKKKVAKKMLGRYIAAHGFEIDIEDKVWFRGFVTNWQEDANNDLITVFAIDYGDTELVSLANVQPLQKSFCNEPRFAVKCHLADIYPINALDWTDQRWPESAIELFKNLVQNTTKSKLQLYELPFIKVCGSVATSLKNSLPVQLSYLNENINDILCSNGLANKSFAPSGTALPASTPLKEVFPDAEGKSNQEKEVSHDLEETSNQITIMPCIKGKNAKLQQSLDALDIGEFTVKHHLKSSIQCKPDSESGQLASENQYSLSKCILAPVFKPSNQHAANAPVTTERDAAVDQISESLKTEKTEEILDNGVNIKCEQSNSVENVSEILESPSVNVAECKVDNFSLKVNPKNEEILENAQSENKMISLETSRSVKPSNHLPIDDCIELSSEDHQWPVVINHIISPGEFYVQSTVTTDLSRMKNLLGLLNETYYDKSSQLCRYHKIKNNFRKKIVAKKMLGRYIAAHGFEIDIEDKVWFRGFVTNWQEDANNDLITVFAIDYGDTELVSLANVQPLLKSFCNEPRFAVKCHLADIYPINALDWTDQRWPESAIELFKNLVQNTTKSKLQLYELPFIKVCGSVTTSLKNSLPVQLSYLNENINDILCSNGLAIKSFALSGTALPASTPLKEVFPDAEGKSNQEKEVSHDLEETSNQVKDECCDLKALDNCEELFKWVENNSETFNQGTGNYGLDVDDPSIVIHGYAAKDDSRNCHIFAKYNECFKGLNCRKEHTKEINHSFTQDEEDIYFKVMNCNMLPLKGKQIDITVTCVKTVNMFYCHLSTDFIKEHQSEYEEDLHSLMTSLNSEQNIKQMKELTILPSLGQCVLANNPKDNLWYRARVLDFYEDLIDVFFFDFGFEETVLLKNIRQIEPRYLHLPMQAYYCNIRNMVVKKDCSLVEAQNFIIDSIGNCQCMYVANVFDEDSDKQNIILEVDLYDSDMVSVADLAAALEITEPMETDNLSTSTCLMPG